MKTLANYKYFLLIPLFLTSLTLEGQFFKEGWNMEAQYAFTEHDTRWFGVPPRHIIPGVEVLENRGKGTNEINVLINKKIFSSKYYVLSAGMGIGYENQTFLRPFSWAYKAKKGEWITYDLNIMNNYTISTILIPINNRLQFGRFSLNTIVQPEFVFFKHVDAFISVGNTRDWRFQFYSMDISQALGVKLGPLEPFIGYRWTQFKKRDDVYYYGSTYNQAYRDGYEWLQLKKWFVGVRFFLGEGKKNREN